MLNKHERRMMMERLIYRRVVRSALALGYSVAYYDAEDEDDYKPTRDEAALMKEFQAMDMETLDIYVPVNGELKLAGSIFFVYGNDGWDVIADYSDRPIISRVIEDADKLSEWLCDRAGR